MNDINLETINGLEWDINFINNDLDNLTGEDQVLQNAIILTILTRQGELNPNPTYNDYGSRLHELIKDNDNHLTRARTRAFIKQSVEAMNRVHSVDDVVFSEDKIHVYVTKTNGDRLSIGIKA